MLLQIRDLAVQNYLKYVPLRLFEKLSLFNRAGYINNLKRKIREALTEKTFGRFPPMSRMQAGDSFLPLGSGLCPFKGGNISPAAKGRRATLLFLLVPMKITTTTT